VYEERQAAITKVHTDELLQRRTSLQLELEEQKAQFKRQDAEVRQRCMDKRRQRQQQAQEEEEEAAAAEEEDDDEEEEPPQDQQRRSSRGGGGSGSGSGSSSSASAQKSSNKGPKKARRVQAVPSAPARRRTRSQAD
jgi:hypothetical protein